MIRFKTAVLAVLAISTGLVVSSCDFNSPLAATDDREIQMNTEMTGVVSLSKEIPCGETETAWAFGEYTFIDEGIAVRWGWFQDLSLSDLPWETEIWAAAGQNDTTKGSLVGSLLVSDNGDGSIEVEFMIDSAYSISESHLFVGADAPTTQAPGQLGHLHENLGDANYDSYTIDLAGLTSFYLAAHGVVGGDCGGDDDGDGDGDGDGDDDDDPVYNLNGTIYLDVDESYGYDGGDSGLEGITVELYDAAGNLVATTMTDISGAYSFGDLADGTYMVVVDPEGTLGGLAKLENDAAASITISGADVMDVNVGFDLPNVSGTVFFDDNQNGVQDPGEEGIPGITVILSDGSTAVTNADGNYLFEDVFPGSYTVDVDPEGTLDGLNPSTATSQMIEVGYADVMDVDFGYELPVINGTVFFDVTGNGMQDVDEPGIDGVTVNLVDEFGNVIATTTTDANGSYEFEVMPGDYTVVVEGPDGLNATTPVSVDVTVGYADETVDFGFELDFTFIGNQNADGYTIGFWKNNVGKAIAGKQKGIQIDAATLMAYVSDLSEFALYPLNVTTLDEAYDILSANGSDPVLLLSKQLMGSEFNLMNGAYIGGNELLTELFLYYGEYLIAHADQYSASDLLEAKDWYDAYNNSHGGLITLP
jgi:hypothetical protein